MEKVPVHYYGSKVGDNDVIRRCSAKLQRMAGTTRSPTVTYPAVEHPCS